MPFTIYKPPTPLPKDDSTPSIFLSGSIADGDAPQWQTDLADSLSNLPIHIYDPRRIPWPSHWDTDINTNPDFEEQLRWEFDGLGMATVVVVYFHPDEKKESPITLLELGMQVRNRPERLVVCCPEGYRKRGNVQFVCKQFRIKLVDSLKELGDEVRRRLEDLVKGEEKGDGD